MNNFIRKAFGVWNGYAPAQGPKALPYTFNFNDGVNGAEISDDLLLENTSADMQFVQGMYVDNSENAVAFSITFKITNQRIVVPAFAQGIWPVFAPDQTSFVASVASEEAVTVRVLFVNVPTAYTQWGPFTVNIASVTATFTPTAGTFADFSSGITLGGTSQELFAANAAAIRRVVQNPVNNAESIYINFGGIAASDSGDSIELLPGQIYDTGTGPIDQTQWTIIAASTATPYIAKEMEAV